MTRHSNNFSRGERLGMAKYRSRRSAIRVSRQPGFIAVERSAEGSLGVLQAGAIAPRRDPGPVGSRDRQRPEPFTARLGLPFLPDAADRLAILQHDVVEKVGVDRRADVELT